MKYAWPRLNRGRLAVFTASDEVRLGRRQRWGVGLNRYPGEVIGAYVVLAAHVWGFRWKRGEA